MKTPPHTRRTLDAQIAICQDLLNHFKNDQENLLSLIANPTGGSMQPLYVAALKSHRSRLTYTGQYQQRQLVTQLRLLADMVEDDERSAVAEIDKALPPNTIVQPASNPTALQR